MTKNKANLARILVVLVLCILAPCAMARERAQGLGFIAPNQKSPIAIEADNGLEWRRKDNVYIARGNASAKSGDMSVMADELRSYYRGGEGKSSAFELYKLEAIGNVQIQSGNNNARADEAFYDLDQSTFVMTGKSMRLTSDNAILTATDRIEFWQDKNLAVARGKALAQQGKNRIEADVLSAHFVPTADKAGASNLSIRRVDADGRVKIQSDGNLGLANAATYDLASGIATLKGDVKLTQGPNQLNGEYAEMNTKTGISKLLAGKDNTLGAKRVRAMVIPQPAKKTGG